MRIWTSPYQLIPRRSLSSRVSSKTAHGGRFGALLKVEFASGEHGYADLHPWKELGDEPLPIQLDRLGRNRPTRLAIRSLAQAHADAVGRASHLNLFEQLEVPRSHWLITQLDESTRAEVLRAQDRGFEVLKIKIGRDLESELAALVKNEPCLAEMSLRLDAGATPRFSQICEFLERLPGTLKRQIEFIEDPCAFEVSQWAELAARVPIAWDQARAVDGESADVLSRETESDRARDLVASGTSHLILKPAAEDPDLILRLARRTRSKIAVTSYLDHPVGQLGAALTAGRLQLELDQAGHGEQMAVGGLLSQAAYEPNEFSEAWTAVARPEFVRPAGTGIGFDELLERQDWRELK